MSISVELSSVSIVTLLSNEIDSGSDHLFLIMTRVQTKQDLNIRAALQIGKKGLPLKSLLTESHLI